MRFRSSILSVVLCGLAACSGVSVEGDEPDRALPLALRRIVVTADDSWAREDVDALAFLRRVVAKLDQRSRARGYGVEWAMEPPGTTAPGSLDTGRWIVARCDFVVRSRLARRPEVRGEPGGGAEDRIGPTADRSEVEAPRGPGVREFHYVLRGWIVETFEPVTKPKIPAPEDLPDGGDIEMRPPVSRIAVSGDCSFDEAIGSDDPDEWFEKALGKIADGILDHLPRRDQSEK